MLLADIDVLASLSLFSWHGKLTTHKSQMLFSVLLRVLSIEILLVFFNSLSFVLL